MLLLIYGIPWGPLYLHSGNAQQELDEIQITKKSNDAIKIHFLPFPATFIFQGNGNPMLERVVINKRNCLDPVEQMLD